MQEYEVAAVTPPPPKKRKRKTKSKSTKKNFRDFGASQEDSDGGSESSERPVKKHRTSQSTSQSQSPPPPPVVPDDEESIAKYTREHFPKDVYKMLESMKKVARRYFLMVDLFVYTDGETKTASYVTMWRRWAASEEAPEGSLAIYSRCTGDAELLEAGCIYVSSFFPQPRNDLIPVYFRSTTHDPTSFASS